MSSSVFMGVGLFKTTPKAFHVMKMRGDRGRGSSRLFRTPRAALTADRAALDITKMEPLGDRVLVKPLEAEDQTAGGVLLPSSATDTSRDACFGEILSVGDDVKLELKKGDKVVFNMMSSAKVEVVDGEIVFLHDKSILATLE